jgi:spermidine/putrescine transport system permease protein
MSAGPAKLWKRYALVAPLSITTILAVLVSLGLVVALSFQTVDVIKLFTTLTTDAYVENLGHPLFWRLLWRSIVIAFAVTAVTIALAYPAAYFISFKTGRWKNALLVIVSAPFFTSYLLRIFGWKIILGYNGILNALLVDSHLISEPLQTLVYRPSTIVVALAHAYLAFAVLPIFVALDRIDRSLIEAASDLGARPYKSFLKIVLPLSMPGVLAAALLIFVPTVGDYITPTLIGGPDGAMVANLIQSAFGKANDWPAGSAMSVATIVSVALPLYLAYTLFERHKRRAEAAALEAST